jgi:hypothetical protein
MYKTVNQLPGDGWVAEGIAFYVSPVKLSYTVPLYVVYKSAVVDHFYTTDLAAKNDCVKNLGYEDQGILGWVLPKESDIPESTPLFRWVRAWQTGSYPDFYTAYQDHFYQTSPASPAKYTAEGIECRVWGKALKLPQNLIEFSPRPSGVTWKVNDTPTIGWNVWSGDGYIRLSFSTDNGATWQNITTLQNTGNAGDVNKQTLNNWKVPSAAVGKLKLKVAWLSGLNIGSKAPWATDLSGEITVQNPALRVVPRKIPAGTQK